MDMENGRNKGPEIMVDSGLRVKYNTRLFSNIRCLDEEETTPHGPCVMVKRQEVNGMN